MIQRIQSLWLFLAAALNGLLFISPLYRYNYGTLGLAYSPWIVERVSTFTPLFAIAAVITLLPLVTIFFFKDRKRQKGMTIISAVSVITFITVMMMHVGNLKNGTPPATNFEYLLPGFIPCIIALVFLFFAIAGIRKDDKLVKSMDRLR